MGKSKLHLVIQVDGGSQGNPGPAAAAAIIKDDEGDVLLEEAKFLGDATNNVAEYQGLILGLQLAAQLKPDAVTIKSDSELLVRQVAGRYKVKSEALKPLAERVQVLIDAFGSAEICHIGREANAEADKLVQKAIRENAKSRAKQTGTQDRYKLK